MPSFRIQRLIHWLELGKGRNLLFLFALIGFAVLFSWYNCYKRFAGPRTEYTIEEALIARNLVEGKGFTSPVRYLQTVVFLE